jgi:hypothetical protein
MSQAGINVEGLDKTLGALRIIDPEMKKNLNKEMVRSVRPIIAKVKGNVPNRPARNWGGWIESRESGRDLSWDPSVVKRGIRTSTANSRTNSSGVRSQFRLLNKSIAGAIYEKAGLGSGNGTVQSQYFVRNLSMYGKPPRLLVKTWREEKGYTVVAKAMRGVVDQAEQRVKAAMQ